jgi:hypothetical protein
MFVRRGSIRAMEYFNCDNCKSGNVAYFCLMKNDFVVCKETQSQIIEKIRSGWKKGDPSYEVHRRKTRKEVEVSV